MTTSDFEKWSLFKVFLQVTLYTLNFCTGFLYIKVTDYFLTFCKFRKVEFFAKIDGGISISIHTSTTQRWYDMNGRFQMQGGKNWILPI
jgi:hypothetical protein